MANSLWKLNIYFVIKVVLTWNQLLGLLLSLLIQGDTEWGWANPSLPLATQSLCAQRLQKGCGRSHDCVSAIVVGSNLVQLEYNPARILIRLTTLFFVWYLHGGSYALPSQRLLWLNRSLLTPHSWTLSLETFYKHPECKSWGRNPGWCPRDPSSFHSSKTWHTLPLFRIQWLHFSH